MPPRKLDAAIKNERNSSIARIFAFFAIFLVSSAARLNALDPTSHISQYGHSVWRVQDGYFGGNVVAISQTADGYIWVGTANGLFTFDGVHVVPWHARSGEPLPSSNWYSLLAARDGSLWVGTDGGLFHLLGDRRTSYFRDQGWIVVDILEDQEGRVWIGRQRSSDKTHPLCQVDDTEIRCYGKEDGVDLSGGGSLAQDTSGALWIGGPTGLVRFKPGAPKVYRPRVLQSNENNGGVQALAPAPDGSLWVGMLSGPGGGLEHMVKGALHPFAAPGLRGESIEVTALCVDHQENLWVGTPLGVYKIHGTSVDYYGTADGLSGDLVYKIFEDREGNIWAGTSGGLDMFRNLRVRSISLHEGLAPGGVQSVAASQNGSVWMGTSRLQVLGAGGISSDAGKSLPGTQVTSLFVDHGGRLWVGMVERLYVLEGGRFREITLPNGQPPGMAMGIAEDTEHNIWVETAGPPGRLLEIQDLKVRRQFPPPEVPLARKIVADPHGGIWLGLVTGDLARYQDGHVATTAFGNHPESRVLAITATPDGAILGGTAFGVVGWRDGTHQILTTRNGLPCNAINGLITDNAGNLWLFAPCGLIEIPNEQMQLWWKHADSELNLKVFDVFDGVQPGLGYFNTAAKTPDGRLWFANGNVLQVIDPAHLGANPLPPSVDITAVAADRKQYPLQSEVRLPPRTREMEIDYTALSYVVPQKVLFRYRLDGYETVWHDPGTRRVAFYNDLPPRHYHFRVIACNNDGVWNDTGASLDFSVLPAFYQTNWFRALCVLCFLALLWGIYLLRIQQMQRQFNIALDARVNERTRIARELHDTLLQTLHGVMFQFQAARNLMTRRPDEAMRSLDGAISETKKALAESRDAIQDLRLEPIANGNLAEVLKLTSRELANSNANEHPPVFDLIEEGNRRTLSSTVSSDICRIALELVRNAYQHAQAQRIEAEIRYGDSMFRLRIRDDGSGIDPEVLKEGGRAGHWGLRGLRERADRIGATLDLWSEPGSGTEVQLLVPVEIAYESLADSYRARLIRKVKNRA